LIQKDKNVHHQAAAAPLHQEHQEKPSRSRVGALGRPRPAAHWVAWVFPLRREPRWLGVPSRHPRSGYRDIQTFGGGAKRRLVSWCLGV